MKRVLSERRVGLINNEPWQIGLRLQIVPFHHGFRRYTLKRIM
jgi:hypothetical protein